MKFYGLSPQRVLRVIRNPQRIEEGIVEKTIAVMQPASTRSLSSSMRGGPTSVRRKRTSAGKPASPTWSSEIWAMYQLRGAQSPKSEIPNPKLNKKSKELQTISYKLKTIPNHQIRIISAWRYPGISPKNNPVPDEILNDLGL